MKKLAVFDLDGTLIKNNSHLDILNKHFHKNYDCFLFKVIAKVFPVLFQNFLNKKLKSVPVNFINNYSFQTQEVVLQLFNSKIRDGFIVIIISNAPDLILRRATMYFNVPCFHAPPNQKSKLLKSYEYNYLFVCTDNVTDVDLIKLADDSIIITKKKRRHLFPKQSNFITID